MKFFRLKNADGSVNFVNVENITWLQAMRGGESSLIHLVGGAKVGSGSPTEELVRAIMGEPKTTMTKPTASPPMVTPGPTSEAPAIDFAQIKVTKPARAKAE